MYGCVMPATGGEWCVDASFPKSEAPPPDLTIVDGDPKRIQITDSKGRATTYVLARSLKPGEKPERISADRQAIITTLYERIPFTKASEKQ
jgi:hypothetical protein